jgi:hypothetical protein
MMMYGVLTVTIVQCCVCARVADAAASKELECGMTWYHQQRSVVSCTVVHCCSQQLMSCTFNNEADTPKNAG